MKPILLATTALLLMLQPLKNNAQTAIAVGKRVQSIVLRDLNNNSAVIPNIGVKPIIIMYTDPDVRDIVDPLSDAINNNNYDKQKCSGIGIVNCADTWLANSFIRFAAQQKAKKYTGSIVLFDTGNLLEKAWGLGDSNDANVIIIIGKDQKVRYVKTIRSVSESKAIIPAVLKILDQEFPKQK